MHFEATEFPKVRKFSLGSSVILSPLQNFRATDFPVAPALRLRVAPGPKGHTDRAALVQSQYETHDVRRFCGHAPPDFSAFENAPESMFGQNSHRLQLLAHCAEHFDFTISDWASRDSRRVAHERACMCGLFLASATAGSSGPAPAPL